MTRDEEQRAQRLLARQLARVDAALAGRRGAGRPADAPAEFACRFLAPTRQAADLLGADLARRECRDVQVARRRRLFSSKIVVSARIHAAALTPDGLRDSVAAMVALGLARDCELDDWSVEAMPESTITHRGGCHCGRVRFEVTAPARIQVLECDCSICSKAGYLHLVVPVERFSIVSGSEVLTSYTFNTRTARHLFCSVCGIKSFYVPRADPGSRSVNARCLDPGTVAAIDVVPFDGRRWGR